MLALRGVARIERAELQAPLPISTLGIFLSAHSWKQLSTSSMFSMPKKMLKACFIAGSNFSALVTGRIFQREMQRHQAVIAPMPVLGLLPHRLGEQLFAGHPHRAGEIDGAGDEFPAFDHAAIVERDAGGAAIYDLDVTHVLVGDDGTADDLRRSAAAPAAAHRRRRPAA